MLCSALIPSVIKLLAFLSIKVAMRCTMTDVRCRVLHISAAGL